MNAGVPGSERFRLAADFEPQGDQPKAIAQLVEGVEAGDRYQVLLGVTGSGKTFTMANVMAAVNRPTLVIAPNKTLAAQLYHEFKALFPDNAVRYFVSYYDYYQPEAYVPSTDTYIEKDASINDEIDKMRHSATKALLERNDVVIVASVSCIYGLGSPEAYFDMLVFLERGERVDRDRLLRKLVDIQYERNDYDFHRGTFRVRGDVVEIFPAYEEARALRIELFGDEIDQITEIDPLRGKALRQLVKVAIYPASHYVTKPDQLKRAIDAVRVELRERLQGLRAENKLLEAQRLEQRTMYDLELLEEMGFCPGIENYSRHLTGRAPGEPPPTLINYFPPDYLLFIDESHVTVPQIGGMYRGDRSRKETLVDFGFRLPSALDNRPLNFEEFEALTRQVVYVSATPGDYERSRGGAPGDRAAHPPHRSDRSGGAGAAGARTGRRPAGRDPLPGRRWRAGAGHHPHQEDGGGPDGLLPGARRARSLPALRHRDHRARRDHPRPAPRRLRRAGGHQSPARRSRSARGVAGGDPRRRQGGIPALRALAHPDHRPRGAQRQRARHPLRGAR